jgi:hypothetical protein
MPSSLKPMDARKALIGEKSSSRKSPTTALLVAGAPSSRLTMPDPKVGVRCTSDGSSGWKYAAIDATSPLVPSAWSGMPLKLCRKTSGPPGSSKASTVARYSARVGLAALPAPMPPPSIRTRPSMSS